MQIKVLCMLTLLSAELLNKISLFHRKKKEKRQLVRASKWFLKKLRHVSAAARPSESSSAPTALLISPQVETITGSISPSGPEKIHSLLH